MSEARVWRGHMMVPFRGENVEIWYEIASGELEDWGICGTKYIAVVLTSQEYEDISEKVWAESRL
jgi:hypothetical protein